MRYTFEALEAWSRDNGCPRDPQQTPHEFAIQVGISAPRLGKSARLLADLYARLAYASKTLGPQHVAPLADLWQGMMSTRLEEQVV